MEKIIGRICPEPIGSLHLGNAYVNSLTDDLLTELSKKEGKQMELILRWDETNPSQEKLEYYSEIKHNLEWLGINWDREEFVLDYIDEMYSIAQDMIKTNLAYICTCSDSKIKSNRLSKKDCSCKLSKQNNLDLFKIIKNKKSGVIRLNTFALNYPFNDPILFRQKQEEHPRKKGVYLYPTMHFSSPYFDGKDNISVAIKLLKDKPLVNGMLEVQKLLGYGVFKPYYTSIIHFEDIVGGNQRNTHYWSSLETAIRNNQITSSGDYRLGNIPSFVNRSYNSIALRNFFQSIGFAKQNRTFLREHLEIYQRKYFSSQLKRFVGAVDPIQVLFENSANYGQIYVSKKDLRLDEIIRLKEVGNFSIIDLNVENNIARLIPISTQTNKKYPIVPWLTQENSILTKIILPSEDYLNLELKISREIELPIMISNEIFYQNQVQIDNFGFYQVNSDTKSLRIISR